MTFEEFYCGFTAADDPDWPSDPSFSCSPTEGKMERRKGPPTTITVTADPMGLYISVHTHACVCVMLPSYICVGGRRPEGQGGRAGGLPLLHPPRGVRLLDVLQDHVHLAVDGSIYAVVQLCRAAPVAAFLCASPGCAMVPCDICD